MHSESQVSGEEKNASQTRIENEVNKVKTGSWESPNQYPCSARANHLTRNLLSSLNDGQRLVPKDFNSISEGFGVELDLQQRCESQLSTRSLSPLSVGPVPCPLLVEPVSGPSPIGRVSSPTYNELVHSPKSLEPVLSSKPAEPVPSSKPAEPVPRSKPAEPVSKSQFNIGATQAVINPEETFEQLYQGIQEGDEIGNRKFFTESSLTFR